MFDKLLELENKFKDLQDKMSDPKVLSDVKLITKYSKELKNLDPILKKYNDYKKCETEVTDSKQLLEIEEDEETIGMFQEIIETNEKLLVQYEAELKILLLPSDPNDGKNAIMEIRGAAGGDEANIFAGDLYRMYNRYFEELGWKTEVIEQNVNEGGGFSLISFLIKGDNVFSKLKFESGAHRVQRVPQTESKGRVHTSTATVIVMPEVEDVDVELKESEIRVDVFRSSGAGGQSVNTTDSAVRITHIPTGLVVSSQNERSQIQNKDTAMKALRTKLYDHQLQIQQDENDKARKIKLGSGSRSEKIRTYNYPQNRVTDHRIGLTLNKLDYVIEGKVSEIIDALVLEDQLDQLSRIGE